MSITSSSELSSAERLPDDVTVRYGLRLNDPPVEFLGRGWIVRMIRSPLVRELTDLGAAPVPPDRSAAGVDDRTDAAALDVAAVPFVDQPAARSPELDQLLEQLSVGVSLAASGEGRVVGEVESRGTGIRILESFNDTVPDREVPVPW